MEEESMNIVDYKNHLDSLTNSILNEYMKLETLYLHEKGNSTTSLISMNSKNTSTCEALQTKTDQIYGLEKEIEGYKSKQREYIHIIESLRKDLVKQKSNDNENEGHNKFDMLRSQAKEISAKDKDIVRLTKEICKLKEINQMKQGLSMVVQDEPVPPTTSTTTTSTPTTSTPPPSLPESSNGVHTEDASDKDESDKGDEDDEDDEGSYFIITYRKNKYYRDNDNKVYSIADDAEVGDCIGDWVKQGNGKYKLVKL